MNFFQMFKSKKPKLLKSSELAVALSYTVLRTDFQQRDWSNVQYEGLNRERFIFERTSLRMTAIWLAIQETIVLPERFFVVSKFEMLMRQSSADIIKNCDSYIDAYNAASSIDLKTAALAVADVFSMRVDGKAHKNLVGFAFASFLALYEPHKDMFLRCEIEVD